MADQNQQLAEVMERVNREMALYGELTKDTADALNDAKVGIKGFSAATRMGGDAIQAVGKAATAAAGAMYEGKKGAAAFNDSITELGTAAKIAGAALALLVPGGPIIKLFVAGLGAAVSATADYVKAANEMADKLYSGYSKMAKSGAAASDGMTGLYNDAKKLGLSMSQLDSYVELVGQNAGDLTLFAGSVFEGRKKFADMGKAMEPFREGLMKAGYTQEEINDASMQYLRLQTRIGQSQTLTTQQLAEGAKKYLVEQDALTKLTGMSRQEQEQAVEAARSQQRFRAKLEEMRNSGDAKQIAAADDMELTYKMLYKRSKEAAQGYGDLTTGMLGTEAAMKVNMSTQGEALVLADKQKAGMINGIQAFEGIGKAVGKSTKDFNMLYQTGVGEDMLLKISEGAELGYAANKDLSEEYNKIRKDQKDQGMEGGKAADGITDQYAKNVVQQQKLNKEMEDAVFKGISNAQSVTSGLASATGVLTKAFSTLTDGVNKLLNILGLGEQEPERVKTKGEFEAEKGEASAKEAKDAAFKDATLMQKYYGVGLTDEMKKAQEEYTKAIEKRKQTEEDAITNYNAAKATGRVSGGKITSGVGAEPPAAPAAGASAAGPVAKGTAPSSKEGEGGATAKPDAVLDFTARSGSPSAFNGLEQNLQTAVVNAGEQYNAVTGGKLVINSAKRETEDQKRLYDETVAAGRPGIGPKGMAVAKPGTSLHEKGQAVDIQNYNDPAAVSAMNQQGLSQKVPGDPVHFQFRDGGIARGPETGFAATLHGTEAIIPLKSGAIPIKFEMPTMPDMPEEVNVEADSEAIADMITEFRNAIKEMPTGQQGNGSMAELTSMIGELLREQRNANDISSRILQVSAN